jgi:hypothetical protein
MNDAAQKPAWIPDVELEDVEVFWSWSYFDGREGPYNAPGEYNFTIFLPESTARELLDIGWNVRERDPREEGDEPRWTLEIKISDKYGMPKAFLIKENREGVKRKFPMEKIEQFKEVRREYTDQINVIITPSRWVNGNRTGVTAYVKEFYAEIQESNLAKKYEDLEEV